MTLHHPVLRGAINSSELVASESGRVDGMFVDPRPPGLRVALIHGRALLGEALLTCLQTADPDTQYALYNCISTWCNMRNLNNESIVLFSSDDRQSALEMDEAINSLKTAKSDGSIKAYIVVSGDEEPDSVIRNIDAGADGYISTSMHLRAVVQVIHLIHAGGVFIPASSLHTLAARRVTETSPPSSDDLVLSPRQMLVAKALRKGTPNKLIAYDLNMCESTVKVHVRHIMKKLKARNRTQVAYLTNAMFVDED